MNWTIFWTIMMVACMVWYSTITIYVAIKGAADIKTMLKRLANPDEDTDNLE
jgi:hypothetical protein